MGERSSRFRNRAIVARRALIVSAAALCLAAPADTGAADSPNGPSLQSGAGAKSGPEASASATGSPGLAPVEVRLANARSVKVLTSVLGIELGASLDLAHAKLDRLSDLAVPPKEERDEPEKAGEGEHKILWRFAETDYKALFVKADEKERITSITAFLRPDREQRFDLIGDVSKAPIISDSEVAWDVVRQDQALFRVVARGAGKKADTISIFVVKPGARAEEAR